MFKYLCLGLVLCCSLNAETIFCDGFSNGIQAEFTDNNTTPKLFDTKATSLSNIFKFSDNNEVELVVLPRSEVDEGNFLKELKDEFTGAYKGLLGSKTNFYKTALFFNENGPVDIYTFYNNGLVIHMNSYSLLGLTELLDDIEKPLPTASTKILWQQCKVIG